MSFYDSRTLENLWPEDDTDEPASPRDLFAMKIMTEPYVSRRPQVFFPLAGNLPCRLDHYLLDVPQRGDTADEITNLNSMRARRRSSSLFCALSGTKRRKVLSKL